MRCVIIGCGKIAGGYDNPHDEKVRTHAKAYINNSNCELVGVCDSNFEISKKFANVWGVPFYTTDPTQLLKKCKPDIVSICSPTVTHEMLFSLVCLENIPNIWLEKPAADSLESILRMKTLEDSSNCNVWVNYFRRYDPGFQEVKAWISMLGEISQVRAIYTKGLRHNGSHMLDLIIWFFGKIQSVNVKSVLNDPYFRSVSAKLSCNCVQVDLVALDYNFYEVFEMDIIGDLGRIQILDGGQKIIFQKVTENKYYDGYKNLDVNKVHTGTYEHFMAKGLSTALRGEQMPSLSNEILINNVIELCEESISNKNIY
jgi:predicted dehydrogenase